MRDRKEIPAVRKFQDPHVTAGGEARAHVAFKGLETLWLNTGTLCNLECANCYIESSPTNDRLVYLTRADVRRCLEEIAAGGMPTREIGITGGEPFMNPAIMDILEDCLTAGFKVLVLTNAMTPLFHHRAALEVLRDKYGDQLSLRVSVDHYDKARHEQERGPRSWDPMIKGLGWLVAQEFDVHVAGRNFADEDEAGLRGGFQALFDAQGWRLDAHNPQDLIIFPEMDVTKEVPEITTACWGILGVSPDNMMCATSRMVVRRKGEAGLSVVACTLLPYAEGFTLGADLASAQTTVALNHPHCARFCVLGGASCSG